MSDAMTDAAAFFASLSQKRGNIDLASRVTWTYTLGPTDEDRINQLEALLREEGFTVVERTSYGKKERWFHIHVSELKVHTLESYITRVERLNRLAQQNECEVIVCSVSGG